MEANFREILPVLVRSGVRFILIGGGAAVAHGSSRLTWDVDVVYSRDVQNIRSLAVALQKYSPYLRGARAAGRPRDLDAVAELQALLQERRK
jgi:hypothetical protein